MVYYKMVHVYFYDIVCNEAYKDTYNLSRWVLDSSLVFVTHQI